MSLRLASHRNPDEMYLGESEPGLPDWINVHTPGELPVTFRQAARGEEDNGEPLPGESFYFKHPSGKDVYFDADDTDALTAALAEIKHEYESKEDSIFHVQFQEAVTINGVDQILTVSLNYRRDFSDLSFSVDNQDKSVRRLIALGYYPSVDYKGNLPLRYVFQLSNESFVFLPSDLESPGHIPVDSEIGSVVAEYRGLMEQVKETPEWQILIDATQFAVNYMELNLPLSIEGHLEHGLGFFREPKVIEPEVQITPTPESRY